MIKQLKCIFSARDAGRTLMYDGGLYRRQLNYLYPDHGELEPRHAVDQWYPRKYLIT